jgi:hypothetical protein
MVQKALEFELDEVKVFPCRVVQELNIPARCIMSCAGAISASRFFGTTPTVISF